MIESPQELTVSSFPPSLALSVGELAQGADLPLPPRLDPLEWQVIGRSIRGASHIRSGQPNQDAIHWKLASGSPGKLILAISDGHGSAKCFRSQYGAELAVRACIEESEVFLRPQDGSPKLSLIKREATEYLPQRIVRRWKKLVEEHLQANPVSSQDLDTAIRTSTSPTNELELNENPLLWYGATLLAVVMTDTFSVYLQLGDGEILTVSDGGDVRRIIPPDDRLLGNETTSLCSRTAWQDFRVVFQVQYLSAPALILLSTDGYINSFTDAGQFLEVGSDLLEMIRNAGIEAVDGELQGWLAEASHQGSGDDITLGIVYRTTKSGYVEPTSP